MGIWRGNMKDGPEEKEIGVSAYHKNEFVSL
jgi:hypothetical protein